MSKPRSLTIVRLSDGTFVELTCKTKKLVSADTEYFHYIINKTPFDVACYVKRARNDRQRQLRHRGIPSVK